MIDDKTTALWHDFDCACEHCAEPVKDERLDQLSEKLRNMRDEAASARAACGFDQQRREARRTFEGEVTAKPIDIMGETRRMLR